MDWVLAEDVARVVVLDRAAGGVLAALGVDPLAHFRSAVWLDAQSASLPDAVVVVNLFSSEGPGALAGLPPLGAGSRLVVIHPCMGVEALGPVLGPLGVLNGRASVWNPFPLRLALGGPPRGHPVPGAPTGTMLHSLAPLTPTSPATAPLLHSPALSLRALALALHNATPLGWAPAQSTLLGPLAKDFASLYSQVRDAALNKLSDRQRAVAAAAEALPSSSHLVVIDRTHYARPLALLHESYLGIVSLYHTDFSHVVVGESKFRLMAPEDPVLPLIFNKHFSEVPPILNELARALQAQIAKKDSLTTLDQIKSFVSDLSNVEAKRTWLARHTNLVADVFARLDTSPNLGTPALNALFDSDETLFSSWMDIQADITTFSPTASAFAFIPKPGSHAPTAASILAKIKTHASRHRHLDSTLKLATLLNAKSPMSESQKDSLLSVLARHFPLQKVVDFDPPAVLRDVPELPPSATHVVFLGPVTPEELASCAQNLFFTCLAG